MIALPHTFHDGTNETASGAQVMENLEALNTGRSSYIAAEETRESTSFGTMPTPDQVTVVLQEHGLINIAFEANWRETVLNTATASVFLNGVEVKAVGTEHNEPQSGVNGVAASTQESPVNVFMPLFTTAGGLQVVKMNASFGYLGDVKTGQIVGAHGLGGFLTVFADPGTYTVSVRYKSSSGKVQARGRLLVAWVVG